MGEQLQNQSIKIVLGFVVVIGIIIAMNQWVKEEIEETSQAGAPIVVPLRAVEAPSKTGEESAGSTLLSQEMTPEDNNGADPKISSKLFPPEANEIIYEVPLTADALPQ